MHRATARRLTAILLLALSTASHTQTTQQGTGPTTVLQATSQLVILDVVVQDKSGHPVRGLKAQNFSVTEAHTAQNIRNFEEHTAAQAKPAEPLKLPPGTFTDYTPTPPDGTLNILLLDSLNTPMKDQSYVRYQLQQYVKHADPSKRVAIFGLSTHLVLLQGFTSDPQVLRDAVEHKLIPRASTLLNDPTGSGVDTPTAADAANEIAADSPQDGTLAQIAANVTEFEAMQESVQNQFRLQYTLDAFNDLAHYLSNFPGRKNVIWFSGAFPLNILPDTTLQDPFAVSTLNEDEFRETTNLLSRSQVAVYPIDARGLMTDPAFSASNSGRNYARNPAAFANDMAKFSQSQAAEHSTMATIAEETGGAAYYNTNDLASAVNKAIDAGSNYYTLAYTPADRRQGGSYREIRVTLNGVDSNNLQLSYRHGYYTEDPKHGRRLDTATTASNAPDAAADGRAQAYAHAAMSRGAPTPEEILFKVRVLPASKSTEPAPAKGNVPDPAVKYPGPWQRYDVDAVTLPSEFRLDLQPNGRHHGELEIIAYVYDVNGRLLNAMGDTLTLNLSAENYKLFLQKPISFHLEISAPVRQETYLRIGLHDLVTNRFGVVELPTATVLKLPPPVYPQAPARQAPAPAKAPSPPSASPSATPAPAGTAPSNQPATPTSPPR